MRERVKDSVPFLGGGQSNSTKTRGKRTDTAAVAVTRKVRKLGETAAQLE
jgi:hypothetical protein